MFDALSIKDLPSGGVSIDMPRLRDGNGTAVIPLFTSEERFWNFAEECDFEGNSIQPLPMTFDIFELGMRLRSWGEAEEEHLVTVDPFMVGEDWETLARLCSVEEFCLFLEKFHPVAQGLAEGGLAKFGDAPEEAERIMGWMQPQIDEKVGDVHAVVREHLVEEER